MKLYVFASNSVTNIWAGIGARKWAISLDSARNVGGVETKASRMEIGSFGVFYISGEKSLTTPFIVTSSVDMDSVIEDIWPEAWTFSFSIRPLGSPAHRLGESEIRALDAYTNAPKKNIASVYRVTGRQVFTPAEITARDWSKLIGELSHY